tara:strand:+ start:475 stop:876 length:402 start_codon:yes stop_codon:yes gene_type:complete
MNLEKQSYKSNFKPKTKSKPVAKKAMNLPSDRQILDTLYSHYGKPQNIVKEKVKLFQEYTTPAGWKRPDWIKGEYQLGRVNVYTRAADYDNYMFGGSAVIEDEGKGSWFIGVSQTHVKVWIGSKVDAILEIGA